MSTTFQNHRKPQMYMMYLTCPSFPIFPEHISSYSRQNVSGQPQAACMCFLLYNKQILCVFRFGLSKLLFKKYACVAPDRFLICLTENADDVKWKKLFHSKLS